MSTTLFKWIIIGVTVYFYSLIAHILYLAAYATIVGR